MSAELILLSRHRIANHVLTSRNHDQRCLDIYERSSRHRVAFRHGAVACHEPRFYDTDRRQVLVSRELTHLLTDLFQRVAQGLPSRRRQISWPGAYAQPGRTRSHDPF